MITYWFMKKTNHLSGCADWVDLDSVERQRTLECAMKFAFTIEYGVVSANVAVKCRLHYRRFGFEWSPKRSPIGYSGGLQPTEGQNLDHAAVDETTIQIKIQQFWLYTAAGPETNELLQLRLFVTKTIELTEISFQDFAENTMSN